MKKVIYILVCILFFAFGFLTNAIIESIHKQSIREKAEYNRCVSELINYDDILLGCDKYFLNDKWYKHYMDIMFEEYDKLVKEGSR